MKFNHKFQAPNGAMHIDTYIIIPKRVFVNKQINTKGYKMFVETISREMKRKKITQKKLCQDLAIKETTFAGWKTGKQPRLETAIEVFRYLKISVDEIYELKETEFSEDERELIELYRNTDEKSREIIKATAQAAAFSKSSDSNKPDVG